MNVKKLIFSTKYISQTSKKVSKNNIQNPYNKVIMKTDDWESWKWQLSNSIRNLDDLKKELSLLEDEKIENVSNLPIRITPYFLDLIKNDSTGILRKTVIPTVNEMMVAPEEEGDPLAEDKYKKTECIIHKYPDRCLFLCTNFCSTYCRFCTRSRLVGGNDNYSKNQIDDGIEYIQNHPELRDIILSGGDPLTMSTKNLDYILEKLSGINHIEMIRIGTKVPVVIPQRIDDELISMLSKYKYRPLYINLHFTHPLEITDECKKACRKLSDVAVLGSQTVLLKGINDDSETLKKLFHELLKIRVRPYYLYQMDRIKGGSHFRCELDKMINIMKESIGFTSGFPECIIDTEIGKTPLRLDYVIRNDNGKYTLRNFEKKKTIEY